MKKKLIKKYVLLSLPFLVGSVLYGMEIYNIGSSLLFFGGGYVFIKNLCDYRLINRNTRKICNNKDNIVVYVNRDNVRDKDNCKNRDNFNMNGLDMGIDNMECEENKEFRYVDVNCNKYNSYEGIPGLKRTRRYVRVRRRY